MIQIKPIGIIKTSYEDPSGMPIQGRFKDDVTGRIELFPEYWDGLKDLDGFSHAILIYHFNRAKEANLLGRPFLEDVDHGIFAIRSPKRPNHIGISVVRIEGIEKGAVVFSEVDILNGTPLLDIKPYVSHFDAREDVKNGWIEKHFEDGSYPKRVIV
ncbi:MAG: tRNA (N6-threonylcarbamoyladenosine(37)-N6)-methyltransferase TrmO [Deltaproteobacteria bacterium]|nr:tRNA (N6-threonylcarbamoyladenosine(37)-N6)-methyltransferase TrmO [Deltaproteobacteria bacterium]